MTEPGNPQIEPKTRVAPMVHVALFAAQFGFASMSVVAKGVMAHVHPFALAATRVALSAPILLLLAWRVEHARPTARDLRFLVMLGVLGVFLNQLLFIVGLRYTTATNAGIMAPSIPVFAAGAAVLFGIEQLSWTRFAGIALAVAGALTMLDPSGFELGGHGLGNLLILANCAAYGTFLVLNRPILKRLGPLTVFAWSTVFGGAAVLAVAGGELVRLPLRELPRWVPWGMLYIVVVPTIICHSINIWAVGRSTPSLVAAYTTLQPAITGLGAAIWLGERAHWREAVGSLLIILGLMVVSRAKPKEVAAADTGP